MTNFNYLCDASAAKKIFDRNYFAYKNLGFRIIERGTIVPYVNTRYGDEYVLEFGGVVDSNGRFIKSTVGKFGADDFYDTSAAVHVPATVIYVGLFYPIWGHFISEGLRYFWTFGNDFFRKSFKDCALAYVPFELKDHFVAQKNLHRLLEILGVDTDKLMPINQPTQFENIILPDESFFMADNGNVFTDEYRETVERARNFALKNQTPSAKKIYFFYGQNQIGEERLAEYFRDKGYKIISPEKLTVDEQLNLLINAESFASTLGSCAHNSVFLRNGTECIFIPRAANRFTAYQPVLDRVHALNVTYVDSSLSIFEKINGSYCFIISEQLKKFFGDEFTGYTDDDFKIFLTYVKNSLSGGFKINPNAEKYYGETLKKFFMQLKRREDLMTTYGVKLT